MVHINRLFTTPVVVLILMGSVFADEYFAGPKKVNQYTDSEGAGGGNVNLTYDGDVVFAFEEFRTSQTIYSRQISPCDIDDWDNEIQMSEPSSVHYFDEHPFPIENDGRLLVGYYASETGSPYHQCAYTVSYIDDEDDIAYYNVGSTSNRVYYVLNSNAVNFGTGEFGSADTTMFVWFETVTISGNYYTRLKYAIYCNESMGSSTLLIDTDSTINYGNPWMAVDSCGDVHLVCIESTGQVGLGRVIYMKYSGSPRSWSSPEYLSRSTSPGIYSQYPQIHVQQECDTVHVSWSEISSSTHNLRYIYWNDDSGVPSPTSGVDLDTGISSIVWSSISSNSDGMVMVVYTYGNYTIKYKKRESGSWGSAQTLINDSGTINAMSNPQLITDEYDMFHLSMSVSETVDKYYVYYWQYLEDISYLPGDANDDGSVNVADVSYLVGVFLGYNPVPDPIYLGDANGDCGITGADINYLNGYFYGGPKPWGLCCDR